MNILINISPNNVQIIATLLILPADR